LIDPLAAAGYPVWSIDLIGPGLSDKPEQVSYDLPLFLDQINAFFIDKNIPDATFIGNSMGGGVSLAVTLSNSKLVNSLILIDALGYPLSLPPFLQYSKSLGLVSQPLMGRWAIKHILEFVMYDPAKITEEQIDAYLYPLRMPGGDSSIIKLLQNHDNELLKNMSKQYRSLKMPVLLIWGQ